MGAGSVARTGGSFSGVVGSVDGAKRPAFVFGRGGPRTIVLDGTICRGLIGSCGRLRGGLFCDCLGSQMATKSNRLVSTARIVRSGRRRGPFTTLTSGSLFSW